MWADADVCDAIWGYSGGVGHGGVAGHGGGVGLGEKNWDGISWAGFFGTGFVGGGRSRLGAME